MTVVVSCRCGKRFAAKDHLIGQQVPCPSCGKMLPIAATGEASAGICVNCSCGRAFLAPESMRGQQARCRGCGRVIQVPRLDPSQDPLGLGPLEPLATTLPSAPVSEIPWDTLKLIGGIGAVLLALVMIVMSTMSYLRSSREVAEAERSGPPAAAKAPVAKPGNSSAPPSGSATLPPLPPATIAAGETTNESRPADTAASVTSEKASFAAKAAGTTATAVARLPEGVQDWYVQPGAKLAGIRRVDPKDSPISGFSWMTGLLPFLGHGQLHQQFDFQKPNTKGKNLQLGGTIVPEFLNPLDDYQRWKGYPFDGIALTHFVGISGVEDARNVVAAKLPRSDPRAGIFGYDEVARPEDITDGQSQTVMIAGAGALANPWTFGGGATIRGAREPLFDKSSGLGTKGVVGGGSIVVMADGSVRHIRADIDPKVFKAMCTIHGADSVDLERAGPPYDLHELRSAK